MALLSLLICSALAGPHRSPRAQPAVIVPSPERHSDTLIVKLSEGQGLAFNGGALNASAGDPIHRLLRGAQPLFSRSPKALREEHAALNQGDSLADLSLYLRLHSNDAIAKGNALLADPRIETAYLAAKPVPPPFDIPPETPSFVDDQAYLGPGPDGMGFDIANR